MGLSASQARLLNLTARMHDIEYKAQNLEAQKLQMANESRHVYQEYENAMNKQKIQFKQIGADGSAQFVDASLKTLLDAGYRVKILDGGDWVDVGKVNGTKLQTFTKTAAALTGPYSPADAKVGDIVTVADKSFKLATLPTGAANNYGTGHDLEDAAAGSAAAKLDVNSTEVLRNLVEAGFIVFEQPQRTKDALNNKLFVETNIATDTNLQEVVDPIELRKAEAKYEADMRRINTKDKKFDTDLAALDNERNAIKQEMETLKTVAKENVERTFKLFS